ncbi:hypothetical protein Acife_0102 [Acidithiobacillus ferrivorans SS3]|uniref:Uncharacterized protein n=1 Tax=Acidithiobacillus ferrivorans SS3 TaxID=743299 RepID=G0JQA3_9PROT|nr:hypothetical protein [Acidithiobacillus ferrivorans]AEM46342.1 hypothetical protein Acife_0102 [Acidithiobacillus ferrivorans SS3]
MNAVIQSPAHPLVCAGAGHILIAHALPDRLFAYTGLSFRVSGLHRCKAALGTQRLTPLRVLAGKPPESSWIDREAPFESVTRASCPVTAIDSSKGSAASTSRAGRYPQHQFFFFRARFGAVSF